MLTIVLTWIGAVLGLTLLVAMAAGTLVVDFDEALQERRSKAAAARPTP
jgi:NADH:ubiquinone oxidoreductase subunit 6 (subunit J)